MFPLPLLAQRKSCAMDFYFAFSRILVKDPDKRPSASEVLKLPFIATQMEVKSLQISLFLPIVFHSKCQNNARVLLL